MHVAVTNSTRDDSVELHLRLSRLLTPECGKRGGLSELGPEIFRH